RSAGRSARSGPRDGPGAYRYGDRRWRDDRLPRQRQLLLGGHPVQPDEGCHGVSSADCGHPDPGRGGHAHRVAAQPGAAVMKLVIAPDSFKESISAERVALAIAAGWREVFAEADIRLCPMADGGEGTVEAVLSATGGERRELQVCGPLGIPVTAHWGWLPDERQAVIEMAAASGLHWVAPDQRDARVTTTYGTGELVLAALEAGARRIILGIGGSATNDGGAGLLEALGARLLNEEGQPIDRGGAALTDLQRIELAGRDTRLAATEIIIAAAVDNPLCGPHGASHVSGPQKGASAEQVEQLDHALSHFADVMAAALGQDYRDVPGVGAAGGLGFAARAVLGARFRP